MKQRVRGLNTFRTHCISTGGENMSNLHFHELNKKLFSPRCTDLFEHRSNVREEIGTHVGMDTMTHQ